MSSAAAKTGISKPAASAVAFAAASRPRCLWRRSFGQGSLPFKKKMSIPTTVSRVIKYIPELQKEVDGLEKKKEELRRASCEQGAMRQNTAPIVSATCLDDREIMVQVSLVSTMAGALPMSKCIKVLENQGLRLINSSTSAFQNRTFYSLHLQVWKFSEGNSCRLKFKLARCEPAVWRWPRCAQPSSLERRPVWSGKERLLNRPGHKARNVSGLSMN
ncbi:Transcription factor ORG2 [Triticum urartu]|uniref:Transcription factor ORG2 n=1 Tax=Triticum urartu TaxID=4572 RepID=M7YNP6_TRIUA|nr:Transcription factor ORG2 [Triticum urartu]